MMAKDQDPDACHGWKMEFINPLTGGHAMPTIAAFIQLLPKGFKTAALPLHRRHGVLGRRGHRQRHHRPGAASTSSRATPSSCPPGMPVVLEAKDETVLFSFSDRPGQEAMGLWRRKTGMNAPDKATLSRAIQQPRAGPRAPAVHRALVRVLRARARHHDLLPRPRLRRAARRDRRLFPARKGDGSCLMFIHGGYWRALDKKDFSFLAPPWSTPASRSRWSTTICARASAWRRSCGRCCARAAGCG